jgi:hypothetical protein
MTRFWNWGVGIATVYAVFTGATLGFVTFAVTEHVDLVSPDYYADSLAHDARQAAASRALALGAGFRIETGADGRTISIRWPSSARPDAGAIRLYRPSNSAADRVERVSADAANQQTLHVNGLAAGGWTVQCEWSSGGASYYAEQQVVIR